MQEWKDQEKRPASQNPELGAPGEIPVFRLLIAAGLSFGLLGVFAVLKFVFKVL